MRTTSVQRAWEASFSREVSTTLDDRPDGDQFRWFPQDMTAWDVAFSVVLLIGFVALVAEVWGTINESSTHEYEKRIEGLRSLSGGWLAFILTDLYTWAFRFWRRGLVELGLAEWATWLLGLAGLVGVVILTWVGLVASFERSRVWIPVFVVAMGAGIGYGWVAFSYGHAHFGRS